MSTVAGIAFGGSVVIAADTQVSGDGGWSTYTGGKVFRVGDCLFGSAGDYKPALALPFLAKSKLSYSLSPDRFMQLKFPAIIREFFDQNGVEPGYFELIVGTKGNLYWYESGGEAVNPAGQFFAIGSGGPYAMGALELMDPTTPPTTRLTTAIEVGMKYDSNSGGEVEYDTL